MDKLIVLGVETAIGAGLARALKGHCEVLFVALGPTSGDLDCPTRHVRRGDGAQLAATIEQAGADWLIYAGSLSSPSWDLPASDPAWRQEPQVAESLLAVAGRMKAKLIALSSDAVFAGPKMFQDETAPTTSTHPAAGTILEWERILLAGEALVVRSCAYGWAPEGAEPGLVERIVQALRTGSQPPVDGERFATPIFTADLAGLLLGAADRNLSGLYHISGAERTSSFRLAGQLASLLGTPMPRSHEVRSQRPDDGSWLAETSLDSRRARRALDLPLPMLAEGLERFVDAQQSGQKPLGMPIEQAA